MDSTLKREVTGGDAESLDSGAGSLGPCSLLGPEQNAIAGRQIDTTENIHFLANLLDYSHQILI